MRTLIYGAGVLGSNLAHDLVSYLPLLQHVENGRKQELIRSP